MESPKKVKPKMAIGFDLGTTSVGWSVIAIDDQSDERKLTILDMGVRMFSDPAEGESNTQARRIARGRRRRIWRQRIRKYELFKLLQEYNIVEDETEFHRFITTSIYDEETEAYFLPVELKIKGLKAGLTKQQLTLILHNYIKHRGILNTIDSSEEEDKNEADVKKKARELYDVDKYPCENQYQWYKSSGNVIGNLGNYIITNEDYKREISVILNNQKHLKIDQNFVEKFLALFERHRHYSEGPGSETMLTPYGRTTRDESGNLVWMGDDSKMWDKLVGKCTYYPEEKRNHKKSPVTEVFNLLNDLAKLVFIDETVEGGQRRLDLPERRSILASGKFTLKEILKSVGKTEKHIVSGLRLNDKNVRVIEEMKSTKALLKWLKENNLWSNLNLTELENLELLHQIFAFGVQFQNKQERFEAFTTFEKSSASKEYNLLASVLANAPDHEALKNLSELKIWTSATAALSKRAQMEFITFAITNKDSNGIEQMAFFNKNHNNQNETNQFSKYKFFPNNIFQNEAMPITVKRTFNQAIKVLNAILQNKKFQNYRLSHIIVELARELNSEEEKRKIDSELRQNRNHLETLMNEHNVSENQLKGANRLKFLLWNQQNKQDLYDGQPIELSDLLSNPTKYHIDHIIPISISFINSMQNKVLTKAIHNLPGPNSKGNKTPYQWLSSQGKYADYEKRCLKLLDNEANKKRKLKLENKIRNYLLYQKDPFSELTGFVERQLNDTRYISRLFANKISVFFKASNYWNQIEKEQNTKNVIVNSINGSLTAFARNSIFVEETENKKLLTNRDIYNHHAIDATIIAFLGLNKNIENLLKFRDKEIVKRQVDGVDKFIDLKTGEVFAQKEDFFKELNEQTKYFPDQMVAFADPDVNSKFIRFSRMNVSKTNMPLANETIYSLRKFIDSKGLEYFHKIETLNILEEDKQLANYFGNNAKNKNSLLCYQYDKKLYDMLNKIYLEYHVDDKTNPFRTYLESDNIKEFLDKQKIELKNVNKVPIIDISGRLNWVLKLKIKSEVKKKSNILRLKKHDNNAFYDSLKFAGVRVYKKNDGKYQTVFLSALNLKWNHEKQTLIVNENKIKKSLEDQGIFNHKFFEISSGKMLIKDKELFYFVGGGNRNLNLLEIKSVAMKNEIVHLNSKWKNAPRRSQWQISVNTIAKDFKICNVDYLGNVYDIQSFDEYFEN